MASAALVSTFCPDRVGLVSAITGYLFEQGVNLRDVTFAVMGQGAEFSAVCELPGGTGVDDLHDDLSGLPELTGAQIKVIPFDYDLTAGPLGRVTHWIEVSGGDQPGLIARLADIFSQFGANIVRLDAQNLPHGQDERYLIRFGVAIPAGREDSCLAAVANTAGSLGLTCEAERVDGRPS